MRHDNGRITGWNNTGGEIPQGTALSFDAAATYPGAPSVAVTAAGAIPDAVAAFNIPDGETGAVDLTTKAGTVNVLHEKANAFGDLYVGANGKFTDTDPGAGVIVAKGLKASGAADELAEALFKVIT